MYLLGDKFWWMINLLCSPFPPWMWQNTVPVRCIFNLATGILTRVPIGGGCLKYSAKFHLICLSIACNTRLFCRWTTGHLSVVTVVSIDWLWFISLLTAVWFWVNSSFTACHDLYGVSGSEGHMMARIALPMDFCYVQLTIMHYMYNFYTIV